MSGDSADRKDDELLSQIDELKARMDRLMSGGTSTSNSALLTDSPQGSAPVVEAKPSPAPPPPRKRVGDLLGNAESGSSDAAPKHDSVSFSGEAGSDSQGRSADRPDDRPTSNPPPNKPPSAGGSLIAVDENRSEPRPKVDSFDDLGSAVEQELARDATVPPPAARKGPDLANRFGPADEPAESPKPIDDPSPTVVADREPGDYEQSSEPDLEYEPKRRRSVGTIVAIWIFTAAASSGIAVLHFTGVI